MASRGNKPLKKKEGIATPTTLHCLHCNEEFDSNEFYDSDSELHGAIGKIPYCRACLDKFYQSYLKKYETLEYQNPERKAIERLCMILDIYYKDKIFDAAVKDSESKPDATLFALYLTLSFSASSMLTSITATSSAFSASIIPGPSLTEATPYSEK